MDRYLGKLLDNRYEILEIIGTGGMAVVYRARDRLLNRFVAVKILKDEFARDLDFRRRFHMESQAVAMLSHPNIVSVYDVNRSDNIEYIVMELVEGVTLKEYMERKGALSAAETLHFVPQIASALEHAHSRGIIHRDIKPQNIIILRDGSLKVTDFGIARMAESQQETMTGDALGSVHYVSPEQARGSNIDARSDIYSLGVVMYEMLTGRLPFEGDTPVAVVLQHINSIPLLPSEIKPDIPTGLEEITMKAMSPAPEDRYASATEMLIDLDLCKNDPNIVFDYGVVKPGPYVTDEPEPEPEPVVEPNVEETVLFDPVQEKRLLSKRPRQEVDSRKPSRAQVRQDQRRRGYRDYSDYDDDYDDFRPRARTPVFVFLITGILTAAIFFGGAAFIISTIFGAENTAEMDDITAPDLVGKNYSDVVSSIQYAEYNIVEDESVYSDSIEEGVIISQEPPAGRTIKATTEIYVTVSLGPKKIPLVDLIGVEARAAKLRLESLNLLVSMEYEVSDTVAEGYVIRMDPEPYTELVEDEIVTLVVSLGPEERFTTVPNLIDMTESEAERALEIKNLVLGSVIPKETDIEEEDGLVYDQSVAADTEVSEKTAVDIYVYEYVEPDVPDDDPDIPGENNSSDGETTGTAIIWVPLDTSEEYSIVVIMSMGEVLFEQTYLSEYETVPVTLEGSGSAMVSVYVNGTLVEEEIAVYD